MTEKTDQGSLMSFKPFIMKVGRGQKLAKPLTVEEAYQAMKLILNEGCSEFQMGAFFAAMRVKSEAPDEMAGFIRAVKEIAPTLSPKVESLLDFGDPYDGKLESLNSSPLVVFILAAAGLPCLLHGDRGIPAKYGVGAGEILEELGVSIKLSAPLIQKSIEEVGIGYLHASSFIPRFQALKPFRLQYGLRSSINVIEKMWNLANAKYMTVGIYHAPYFQTTSEALQKLRTPKGYVVQGVEGFGEIRIHRPTKYEEVTESGIRESSIQPGEFGFSYQKNWELPEGASAKHHAEITKKVLEGEKGLVYDSAVLNAGVKLYWCEKASLVREGIERAREVLDSGKARAKLEELRRFTQRG